MNENGRSMPAINFDSYYLLKQFMDNQSSYTLDKIVSHEANSLANSIIHFSSQQRGRLSPSFKYYLTDELKKIVQHAIDPSTICLSNTNQNTDSKQDTETDHLFLEKITALIEKNIDEESFSINKLCMLMCMSRTSLYNKIKKITGKSIGRLIQTIRRRKAVYLLIHEQLPVTEVMYRVGISSPSYFTRFFKKEYQVPPSRFAKKYCPQTTDMALSEF